MINFLSDTPWVLQVGFIVGGFVLGILTELIVVRTIHTLAKRTKSTWDDLLVEGIRRMPILWGTAAGLWGAMLVPEKNYRGCLRVRLVPNGEIEESIYLDLAPEMGEIRREVYRDGSLQFVRELVRMTGGQKAGGAAVTE